VKFGEKGGPLGDPLSGLAAASAAELVGLVDRGAGLIEADGTLGDQRGEAFLQGSEHAEKLAPRLELGIDLSCLCLPGSGWLQPCVDHDFLGHHPAERHWPLGRCAGRGSWAKIAARLPLSWTRTGVCVRFGGKHVDHRIPPSGRRSWCGSVGENEMTGFGGRDRQLESFRGRASSPHQDSRRGSSRTTLL